MTQITAKVILDSISEAGVRLTTMELRYPRIIHSEFMTHRVFSRNARSSRAVPIERMIKEVVEAPFIPLHWGAAQAGMQAYSECNNLVVFRNDCVSRETAWLRARDTAVNAAEQFMKAGYAKQLVNRIIEPFTHIDVLVTSTDWKNFFALRNHPMAEPHIQVLAREMIKAYDMSLPKLLGGPGYWHLPYINEKEDADWYKKHGTGKYDLLSHFQKLSTARCSRISFKLFDGTSDPQKDIEQHDSLVSSHPGHWTPTEHQAQPDTNFQMNILNNPGVIWDNPQFHGNFRGWCQYRKMLPRENLETYVG